MGDAWAAGVQLLPLHIWGSSTDASRAPRRLTTGGRGAGVTCLQSVKVIPGDEVAISRFLRSTSAAMLVEAEAAAEHVRDTPDNCFSNMN
jgi:hypothetical protein